MRKILVCRRGTCSEFANRPFPSSSLVAGVAQAADPAFDAAAPDGFFFALAADEARANVEFFAHKASVLDVGRAHVAWCVASARDAFIVFEVFDASKWVFFLVIEF